MGEVRLTQPKRVETVRMTLESGHPLYVVFAAARTQYRLLFVPDSIPHMGGVRGNKGYYYISVVEFGGSYPLPLGGWLDRGYVQDKLKLRTGVCATNITAFLNALGHPDGALYYLDNIPLVGDSVDRTLIGGGGGLHVKRQK